MEKGAVLTYGFNLIWLTDSILERYIVVMLEILESAGIGPLTRK